MSLFYLKVRSKGSVAANNTTATMTIGRNKCKNFQGLCSCKQTYIKLSEIHNANEHFLAQVLRAFVDKNMNIKENGAMLVCSDEIKSDLNFKLRCDGMIYVSKDYTRDTINYNYVCMPEVFTCISTWKGNNRNSVYIDMVYNVVHKFIGEPGMHDIRSFLEMYVNATR